MYQVGPWYNQYINIWAMVHSYISGFTKMYEYTMGHGYIYDPFIIMVVVCCYKYLVGGFNLQSENM